MAKKENNNTLNLFKDCENNSKEILYYESTGNSKLYTEPHSHQFFTLILIESNKDGYHLIDEEKHKVEGMQLHYLFPDQLHYLEVGPEAKIHQVMINNTNFELIKLALRFNQSFYEKNPVIHLTQKNFEYLLYEFKEIGRELNSDLILFEMICSRIRIILQKASKIIERQLPDASIDVYLSSSVIYAFLNLIDIYYQEQKELTFYARKLNVTANYLGILCKKHLNQPGNKIIKTKLILEAKRRLVIPALSIKEIAFDLGFKEQAHFTNFFKSATGKTPSEFRINIR